jgi:hypothetical protein
MLTMNRASRTLARNMLAKIFIVGVALTIALYYSLNTLTTGFFVYSVQNLLSSLIAGVVVGFLLPKIPTMASGSFAAFASITGSIVYIILYSTVHTNFSFQNLLADVTSNFIAAAFAGFGGGLLGSIIKQRFF